jgi:hypothetical protein
MTSPKGREPSGAVGKAAILLGAQMVSKEAERMLAMKAPADVVDVAPEKTGVTLPGRLSDRPDFWPQCLHGADIAVS